MFFLIEGKCRLEINIFLSRIKRTILAANVRALITRLSDEDPDEEDLFLLWYLTYTTYSDVAPKFIHMYPPSPEWWDHDELFFTCDDLRELVDGFPNVSDRFARVNFCILPAPSLGYARNSFFIYDAILQKFVGGVHQYNSVGELAVAA